MNIAAIMHHILPLLPTIPMHKHPAASVLVRIHPPVAAMLIFSVFSWRPDKGQGFHGPQDGKAGWHDLAEKPLRFGQSPVPSLAFLLSARNPPSIEGHACAAC